ncbi:MAG TPA: arsinothricin resistance N-acetyltransferase ArsN1 family B [Phycisphaerae bacterium]|jgi:phosphinothricin acetyltransferase
MPCLIRAAELADAAAIQSIYAPLVLQTAISFEYEPPAVAELRQRIEDAQQQYPWLVCEHGGGVIGYAYAARHRTRAAYQWCVETSVYVDAGYRRSGVARGLYAALLGALRLQGYCNAYAGIALPNPPSVALHEAYGFKRVGVYRAVGFKLGTWHDVGWWAYRIREVSSDPAPPMDFAGLSASAALSEALVAGAKLIRL